MPKKKHPEIQSGQTVADAEFTDGLELEGLDDVKLLRCKISGGFHNLSLTNCRRCEVTDCVLIQPFSDDSDDPESHNLLADKCSDCKFIHVSAFADRPRGDAINLFNSKNCLAELCVIDGPIAKHGTALIIDGPRGSTNTLSHAQIRSQSRVVVAGGRGHHLVGLDVPVAVEIAAYYLKTSVVDVLLAEVRSPVLFIGKRVRGLIQTKCDFAETEGESK